MAYEDIPEGFKKGRKYRDYYENPDLPETSDIVERAGSWRFEYGTPEYYAYYEDLRRQRAAGFIEQQAALPEAERLRPTREEWNPTNFWDLLSTSEYWAGARLTELKTSVSERRLAFGERSFREKIEPQEFIWGGEKGKKTEEWLFKRAEYVGGIVGQREQARMIAGIGIGVQKFGMNIALDPLNLLTGINTGKTVVLEGTKGTKYSAHLTDEGAKIFSMLAQRFPAPAKIVDDMGRVIAYEDSTDALRVFSTMLKDNPKLAAKLIQKEGLRLVGTNIEVVPKWAIPTNYIKPTMRVGRDVLSGALSKMKQTIAGLRPTPKVAPITPELFNVLKAQSDDALRTMSDRISRRVADFEYRAQKILQNYPNGKDILRESIENPEFYKKFHPELEPLIKEFEHIHMEMAKIERAQGFLQSSRANYLLHFVTDEAKKVLGFKKISKILNPYNIRRNIEATVTKANDAFRKTHGIDLFETNPFFLLGKRMEQHVKTQNAIDFIKRVGQQYGKNAQEASKYKGFVKSRMPFLQDVWLPKEVEQALGSDDFIKQMRVTLNMRTTPEKIFDSASYIAHKGYDFQAWTKNTYSKFQTIFFPGFYAVNYYGGKFMALLGGSANLADDAAAIAAMKMKDPSKVIVVSKIDPRIKYTADDINAIFTKFQLKRVDPVGVSGGLRAFQKAGWAMEEELRGSMMINRLREGDTPEQAYAYMTRFQFDYTTELVGVEKVIDDFVLFYRWQKNAVPFFLEMGLKAHAKMQAISVLTQGTWNSPVGQVVQSYMPEYAKNMPLFFLGGPQGTSIGLSHPAETTGTFMQRMAEAREGNIVNATQYLSPLITLGVEEARGRDTFTGKDVKRPVETHVMEHFFPRWYSTAKKMAGSDPLWEKMFELGLGGRVYKGADWVYFSGVLEMDSKRLMTNALRRTHGRAHGCGF